jgi:tRNA(fMet)-specific endonuclease VapC
MEEMEHRDIIVDTDIIIDYLKKRQPGAALLKKAYIRYRIHVTSISVYELFYGIQESRKEALINRLLRYVSIVSFDEAAAREAAAIHFALKNKGMDIGVKDSFIAGTCRVHNMPLLTWNIRHFSRVIGLKLLSLQ